MKEYGLVKRIKGSQGGNGVHKLCFGKEDGSEILKIELDNLDKYGSEFVLEQSEEIIGIFGNVSTDRFYRLGFIVWKPPRI
jgi:hypothetical protein